MAPHAVDFVVAGHDILGLALGNADFKALQIDFPQGPLGHLGIVVGAVGLLVVAGKVLGAGGDAVLLQAADHGGAGLAAYQGVLGEVLKVPAAQGVAVDVHAGAQEHIAALHHHLTAVGLVEALHQLGVPSAGQGRAAGQQGAVVLQPDAGGAVGGGGRGHAQGPQALGDAAQHAGVAQGAQRAAHDIVAVAQGLQVLGGELGHKVLHRGQAIGHVLELDALVPGEGNLLGHILHNAVLQGAGGLGHRLVSHLAVLVDHALKGHHRGADLFQLGEHPQLRHSDGALLLGGADIGAHIHGVVAGLQHPGVLVAGGAGVVIAGQVVHRELLIQHLAFPGLEQLGLFIGAQHPGSFAQNALGRGAVHLHHFLAGVAAGVLHGGFHPDGVAAQLHLDILQSEGSVGQAKAKGELDLVLGEGLEVAVAHVNVLGVDVGVVAQEVGGAGMVLIAVGDGVGELAAGSHGAGEHIGHSVSALHAALPHHQRGGDGILLQPGQVHDAAGIDEHHGLCEGACHLGEQLPLRLGEVIAAGLQGVLPVLAGGAADDHHGGLAAAGGRLHLAVLQGHLLKIAGPVAPEAHKGLVFLAPLGVGLGQLLVHLDAGVPQALHQVDGIGRVHVAAGAVAHVEVIQLHPSKHSHGGILLQGQGATLVFQQHNALGGRLTAQGGQVLLNHFLTKDRLAGFLHQLVQVIQKLRGYLVQDFLGDIVDIHVCSSFVFFKKSYCYYLTLSLSGRQERLFSPENSFA